MQGHLEELQAYNLEYLEAQQSEEIFGGDYTGAVELKYAKKEIERLNNIIKELDKQNVELGTKLSLTTDKYEKKLFIKENIIKEVNELIEEYKYTNVEDYGKIIEFFKKLKTILDKEKDNE